jgi:glycosyltransferase involved in cell wall biosynthesis
VILVKESLMPARIVTISDHIDCPTGFGVQHRHLAIGLARAGFEVHALGLWDRRPLAVTADGLTRYPGGQGGADHQKAWRMYRDLLRPDLVITLGDLETFAHLNDAARRPFAWCHWLPLDAEPYPHRQHERMLGYDRLVLMSRWAHGLVQPHLAGRVPLHVIPHGVDTDVFRPMADPLALRRKWAARLGAQLRPEDFLLVARDTNQWRKQQPLLLEALGRLPRDVKLLLHCRPVAHPDARGWDLEHAARLYGVADRVVFTGRGRTRPTLEPRELAELDNLADLRVSATMGEGFGVCTLEAMACGTPTAITDYATSRELLRGECGGTEVGGGVPGRWNAGVQAAVGDGGRGSCFGFAQYRNREPGHGAHESARAAPPEMEEQAEAHSGIAQNRNSPALTQRHREANAANHSIGVQERRCFGIAQNRNGPRAPVHAGPSITRRAAHSPDRRDRFGPAGELVRAAAWTLEHERDLFRPIIDPADLAAKVRALRDDRGRLAQQAEAGLRRVLAHYTLDRVAHEWVRLVREVLADRDARRRATGECGPREEGAHRGENPAAAAS